MGTPLICVIFQTNQANRNFFSQGFLARQNLSCHSNESIERIGAVRKNKRFIDAIETSAARSITCATLSVSADERKKRASSDKACKRKTAGREKGSSPAVFAQLFSMSFF